MSQKELNLFQFTARLMAQSGTCPPEIVRRKSWNLTIPCLLLNYTPNDLGAEAGSPYLASLIDRTEEDAGGDSGGRCPGVNPCFHPIRNWNGADVSSFADKISNDPVFFSLLDVFNA
jgi:hypothetical protein